MEFLPLEILEVIVGYTDERTSAECRLVSCRWNVVATRRLRQTCLISFASDSKVNEFLTLAELNSQDLPFCNFLFKNLDKKTIESMHNFFDTYGSNINWLDTNNTAEVTDAVHEEAITQLLVSMGTLPRLRQLSTNLNSEYFASGTLCNISKLELGEMRYFPVEYIQAAPNLRQIVISKLDFCCDTCSVCTLDIPEEYKVVALIKVGLLRISIEDQCCSTNKNLVEKMENWNNIHIVELVINGEYPSYHPSDDTRSPFFAERVMHLQAKNLERLSISDCTKQHYYNFRIPEMRKLRSLVACCRNSGSFPFANIESSNVPILECVKIYCFMEPLTVFSGEIFEKVTSLTLFDIGKTAGRKDQSNHWTNFATVFPNLVKFKYKANCLFSDINFDLVEHIFSTLKMDTLRKVKFYLLWSNGPLTNREKLQDTRPVKIFSGFDDLGTVVQNARIAASCGILEERACWEYMEKLRRHSFVGIMGLTLLKLDFPVSDDFVEVVLLRIPTLDSLSVVLYQVSNAVRKKLEAHHSGKLECKVMQ